ncbi:Glutamate receptor ionotropic, delta-1 [Nymphon striatum]|nr:Glutamate receptor ionotropic, delta-1 [Nymphon striatum]
MIGDVQFNRADMAVSDITITDERYSFVEFSPAIIMTSYSGIYNKNKGIDPFWTFYLAPFTIGTWICLVSIVIIIMLLIIVLNKKFRFSRSRFSVLTVLSSVTGQGTEFVYRYNGQKLLHFILLLFGMLICYFYQSKIISNHIVEWEQPPIKNLDDISKSNTYYPIFRKGTAIEEVIMNSSDSSFSAIKQMVLRDKKKHLLPTSLQDSSELEADGRIYFTTMLSCKVFIKNSPTLIILEEEFMYGGIYFVWQKNLSIGPILKRTFMKMKENGIIQRLYTKYFEVKETSASLERKNGQITLDVAALPFLYIIFCLIILLIYHLFHVFNYRKNLLSQNILR